MILAARTGRWKSIFAEHMSIVLKPEGAAPGRAMTWSAGATPCAAMPGRRMPSGMATGPMWWPRSRARRRQALIPRVEASIAAYPHSARGAYTVWPGPNSNSFVAWVVRNTEGFSAELPPVAIGKDYLGAGLPRPARRAARASRCLGLGHSSGLTLGLEEGLESASSAPPSASIPTTSP